MSGKTGSSSPKSMNTHIALLRDHHIPGPLKQASDKCSAVASISLFPNSKCRLDRVAACRSRSVQNCRAVQQPLKFALAWFASFRATQMADPNSLKFCRFVAVVSSTGLPGRGAEVAFWKAWKSRSATSSRIGREGLATDRGVSHYFP